MKNYLKTWVALFVIGIVMILGSHNWTRYFCTETSWIIAGICIAVMSGTGILLAIYRKK